MRASFLEADRLGVSLLTFDTDVYSTCDQVDQTLLRLQARRRYLSGWRSRFFLFGALKSLCIRLLGVRIGIQVVELQFA